MRRRRSRCCGRPPRSPRSVSSAARSRRRSRGSTGRSKGRPSRCCAASRSRLVCVPFLLSSRRYRAGQTAMRVWLVAAAVAASLRTVYLCVSLFPLPLGQLAHRLDACSSPCWARSGWRSTCFGALPQSDPRSPIPDPPLQRHPAPRRGGFLDRAQDPLVAHAVLEVRLRHLAVGDRLEQVVDRVDEGVLVADDVPGRPPRLEDRDARAR